MVRVGRQALSWGNGLSYAPMDLVNPFDPAVRERDRLERLFGFTYRNEMFVPAAQREAARRDLADAVRALPYTGLQLDPLADVVHDLARDDDFAPGDCTRRHTWLLV